MLASKVCIQHGWKQTKYKKVSLQSSSRIFRNSCQSMNTNEDDKHQILLVFHLNSRSVMIYYIYIIYIHIIYIYIYYAGIWGRLAFEVQEGAHVWSSMDESPGGRLPIDSSGFIHIYSYHAVRRWSGKRWLLFCVSYIFIPGWLGIVVFYSTVRAPSQQCCSYTCI